MKEMTQTQSDALAQHIDDQHNELLRKIDELDQQVTALLEEWVGVAQADEIVAKSN